MGDYSWLYVGTYQVFAWRNEIPPVNDPIINFIFKPGDKKIKERHWRENILVQLPNNCI
ncbi:MAG: hypothetical protein NHB15_11520 [Methanosarcina barkeri]|nr:hypothetical protein [Methanosarcina sp. ERenArc_MAG2]